MQLTNKHKLPQPVVDAVNSYEYKPHSGKISVTELIDSPRVRQLKSRHHGEMSEDVSDRLYALMGQAMHKILEESNNTGVIEKRLESTYDNWKVSGQFDRYDPETKTIQDYMPGS